MKYIILLLAFLFLTASCKKEIPQPAGWCDEDERIGCVCNDSTMFSWAPGTKYKGECVGHGGFKNYMCN